MSTPSPTPCSASSFHRPPPSSSSAPGSSGSPTLTSLLGLSSSSLFNTEIEIFVDFAFWLALIFLCFLWTKQRRRDHRDDIYGRTPQFPVFKIFNFFGFTGVRIQMPPSCPVHLGNPAGAPPSPQVSVLRPPTSQPLNTGVDSISGLPASQQPLLTPPPVFVTHPPSSQPVLNSAVDLSSDLSVSQQPLRTLRPVSEPRPPTSQPVLNSGINVSSGFPASQQPSASPPPETFTIEELKEATDSFSNTNLLGHGGFGHVYKGILPGSKTIAVKWFNVGGSLIEHVFQTELEITSRVNHRNLVSLLGYCNADSQRLLVYEFVPNNTLEHHLHAEGQPCMEWPIRLKIAGGVARGLVYLHENCYPKIIHLDITPSNILLDSNFEPMIADFGGAKLASEGSHFYPPRQVTFGYFDPEVFTTGVVTDKTDVYSFGVVLLELITGRRAADTTPGYPESILVDSTRPKLVQAMETGNLVGLVDPRLQDYSLNEMMTLIACAYDCVQKYDTDRPSMKSVQHFFPSESSN